MALPLSESQTLVHVAVVALTVMATVKGGAGHEYPPAGGHCDTDSKVIPTTKRHEILHGINFKSCSLCNLPNGRRLDVTLRK